MEIVVETIKQLLSKGISKENAQKLCVELYDLTEILNEDYPKRKSWFYQKQLPETLLENSERDIIFARDKENNIYGTAFVKKDENEKKICTLFVSEQARGLGVGTKLVEKSMEVLGTTQPMITLADYKLLMFEGIIKKYGWKQTQVVKRFI